MCTLYSKSGDLMEKYLITFKDNEFKYLQLYRYIKKLVEDELIEDGEKLPSIRELSRFLNVNSATVINAYKKLISDGFANSKEGSGTFIRRKDIFRSYRKDYSDTFKKISSGSLKSILDFTGENTSSEFFSTKVFKEVLNEVLDRDGSDAFAYQDPLGYKGLRESISKCFWKERVDAEDILILSGAQQGIDIISRVLINANDGVLVEKPTYSGALALFNWRKARIYEINMLNDGPDLESMENILKKSKVRFFYTMSYFQNPTGATYSKEKKLKLLKLANKYNFYIIEDDYLSELIYDSKIEYESLKGLDKDNKVIYIKSFSKVFLPGIRIGYLISPGELKDSFQNAKVNSDISTSSLMQRALDLYINNGYWAKHIDLINEQYKKRYYFLDNKLKNQLGNKIKYFSPGGGLYFFINIRDSIEINSMELFYRCRDEGILITPGGIFFKNFEEGSRYFRMGFCGISENDMSLGIETINRILV
jgi:DNA-binding transcriptional MocR family regulator